MRENILEKILNTKIKTFVENFSSDSKNIFLNNEGSLIHPGEFGNFREKLVKDLLRSMIPYRLDIGTGFIVTSKKEVSTQCDIIIYDRNNTPLIENDNNQRFFPIECVVAVGEVKSDLEKEDLKKALIKLKNHKVLREQIPNNNPFIFPSNNNVFDPKNNVKDQIVTFVICNKLKFDYENILDNMNSIYDDCPAYLRHNFILSVSDKVLFTYKYDTMFIPYPIMTHSVKTTNVILKPFKLTEKLPIINNENEHIIDFLNFLYLTVSDTSILYIEFSNYLGQRLKDFKEGT